MRRDVPRLGLETPHRSRNLRDIALEILEIAREGLHRRARRDSCGEDETHYLDALFTIAGGGRTPAEELVEDFRTRWGGRIEPIFTERRTDRSCKDRLLCVDPGARPRQPDGHI